MAQSRREQRPPLYVPGSAPLFSSLTSLPGDRFGARHRPYITHEAKAASVPLLHEMSVMWATQFARTATHPFRETAAGESDPSMLFQLVHFTIERWREALLWAWAVGRHGAVDDGWSREAMDGAWVQLGGVVGEARVGVRARLRESLDLAKVDANLRASGHREADSTKYEFSESRLHFSWLLERGLTSGRSLAGRVPVRVVQGEHQEEPVAAVPRRRPQGPPAVHGRVRHVLHGRGR